MKQLVVKNILSFLELDDRITEIASNQIKILTYLENKQDYLTNNNIDLLNPNVIEPVDSTFKNIIYYTMGTVLILGVIYYFTFGGGNGETINNIYSTIHDISQKINENNLLINNNTLRAVARPCCADLARRKVDVGERRLRLPAVQRP